MIARRRAFVTLGVAAVIAGCGGSPSEPPPASEEVAAATPTPPACPHDDDIYGTPAKGFEYNTLSYEDRLEAIESVGLDAKQFGEAEASLVTPVGGEGDNALLLAVPLDNPENALEDFAVGATEAGNEVTREDVAGHDVRWEDHGADGVLAVSVKGCHLVWVVAADKPTARKLAKAVFA